MAYKAGFYINFALIHAYIFNKPSTRRGSAPKNVSWQALKKVDIICPLKLPKES